MKPSDQDFLNGMWKRAEEKEQNLSLARELMLHSDNGKRKSFLWDIWSGLGIRTLYAGMTDILAVAFTAAVLLLYLAFKLVLTGTATAYSAAFTTAPVIYASIFYLSLVKEQQNGTYEQQMSYKYTFFHLLAARMFTNSMLGMFFNLCYTLILIIRYSADALRILSLSFASLMLFSLLLAAGIEHGRRIGWGVFLSAFWIILNLLLFSTLHTWYQMILEQVPVILLLITGVAAALIYSSQVMSITRLSFRKEHANAAN